MAELQFRDLSFEEEKDNVRVRLLQSFFFTIPKKELQKIGVHTVQRSSLSFPALSEKEASNKFKRVLAAHITQLKNIANSKPSVYIHQGSCVPLFGSRTFGIVDKGSSLLEVKPLTSCNISCTFCSVDEGIASRKVFYYVLEEEFLLQELRKLMEFKGQPDTHIYLNPHGEPTMYARLIELIRDMREIKGINRISLITNGSLLTEQYIDQLAEAGLTHLNLSLNAYDSAEAKMLAGTLAYNSDRIRKMAEYTTKKWKGTLNLIIAPVWVDGQNDAQIEKLIVYGKELGVPVRIQKFCINKHGRNPAEEVSWEAFFAKLAVLEKKYDIRLQEETYKLDTTKELPKPFEKGEMVKARIVFKGRTPRERYAIAGNKKGAVREFGISGDRLICVQGCTAEDGETVKIRITKDAHNVFYGEQI